MKNLKTFLDVHGNRVAKGAPVADDYDKNTLAHYTRLGLIGVEAESGKPAAKRQRQPKPAETKPAGPNETGEAGEGFGQDGGPSAAPEA